MGMIVTVILSIGFALLLGKLMRFGSVLHTIHNIDGETFRVIMYDGYPEDTKGFSEEKSMWYKLNYLYETPYDNNKWLIDKIELNKLVKTEYDRLCKPE